MKKLFLIAILLPAVFSSVFSQAMQNPAETDIKVFEQKLIAHSENIKTLQCSFLQEKTSTLFSEKAVSTGKLFYISPGTLRWEYTEPGVSTFIINGNDAVLLGSNNEKLGNERMFKDLAATIISLINGNGIAKGKLFKTVFNDTGKDQIHVVLTPVQKRLKDYFLTIEMMMDTKTMLANEIVLNEKSGDKTVLYLTNRVLNEEISSSMFTIK